MGNCFAMNQLVHPSDIHRSSNIGSNITNRRSANSLRIKVKMTRREFKELTAQADLGKNGMDIGRLIVKECLKGNCDARVVSSNIGREVDDEMATTLETITEE